MNKHEYLLKHFFDFPERQLKTLLQQVTLQTGFDCNEFESFETITQGDEPFIENIGYTVTFSDSLGVES